MSDRESVGPQGVIGSTCTCAWRGRFKAEAGGWTERIVRRNPECPDHGDQCMRCGGTGVTPTDTYGMMGVDPCSACTGDSQEANGA